MKRLLLTLAVALSTGAASAQWVDDLYASPSNSRERQTKERSTPVEQEESYQYDSNYSNDEQYATTNTDVNHDELLLTYEDALQRRINAIRTNSEMDQSYWDLMSQYQAILENKYDQNLYNIVVVGKDMWVEPQHITALFDGSDPAAGAIAYNEDIKGHYRAAQYEDSDDGVTNIYNIYLEEDDYYEDDHVYISVGYNWGWGYGYSSRYRWGYDPFWDPYYDPFWGPYYRPYYSPYYRPYYRPYPGYYPGGYYPGYYPPHHGGHYPGYRPYYPPRNPRGTYYGNDRYYNSGSGGNSSMGGGRNNSGSATVTDRRNSTSTRLTPTGANTVSGVVDRRTSSTKSVPTGSVSESFRTNTGVVKDASDRRTTNSTVQRMNGEIQRPTTTQRNTTTTRRETTTRRDSETTTNRQSTTTRNNTSTQRNYDRPSNDRRSTSSPSMNRSTPSRSSSPSVNRSTPSRSSSPSMNRSSGSSSGSRRTR